MLSEQLAMARIRRGPRVGFLTDAFAVESFVRNVVTHMQGGKDLAGPAGTLQFRSFPGLKEIELGDEPEITYLSAEQSNSSVVVGGSTVLKLIRHVRPGVHPELEMSSFLTEHGFAYCAQMLGQMTRVDDSGEPHALMVLQRFVNNQGDAWQWTQSTLERAIRDQLAGGMSQLENQFTALSELEDFSTQLGMRAR